MRARNSALAILTLAASLSLAQSAKPSQTSYFPTHLPSQNNRLDDFVIGWYSQQLTALQEPSLWKPTPESDNEVYRFLWLRTFHHPIAVRLEVLPSGEGKLTTKIADGAGGYNPGKLFTNTTTTIPKEQVNSFLRLVTKDSFWALPTQEKKESGEDGSEWIVEGNRQGKYHVVSRWSPASGPVFDLGDALAIGMAKIEVPKKEFY